ncbi:hypothetical protein B0H13DRAFT_1882521 [Mycena leptocephala]|nr:hypothetical protein B0H13DRAFT_1882521 [Mycena leptocephala]
MSFRMDCNRPIHGQEPISLLQHIRNVLPYPHDHHLEAYFITEWLNSWTLHSISNTDTLVSDGLEHFKKVDDPDLKCMLPDQYWSVETNQVHTGRFYNCLVAYYQRKGDTSSATKFCEAAISLALSTGNTKWHSQGLYNLARVQWYLGDYSAAQVHANEAQQLAIISADLYREAQALDIEATCCDTLGNYTKAMSLCIRARGLLGLCGLSQGNLDHKIMTTQAEVYRHKSEYVQARNVHTQILEEPLYRIPAAMNDVQRNCDRARKMFDTLGNAEGVTICDVILADLYLREGNSLAGKTIFKRCLTASLEYFQITTYCLERLGDASCWGDLDGMSGWAAVYLVNSLRRKEKLGIYKALRSLGDIFLAQHDEHTATSLFTVALEGFTKMDVHHSRAECMLRFGDISMGHSEPLKAVEYWERARPLFELSSQAKQVQYINERLAGISNDVLEQHRNNLARLAELHVPAGTIEELEDDQSDIKDLDKLDMGEENELGLIAA